MATDSINLDTTVIRGVVCRECGNELAPHTCAEHMDKEHPIHTCPHKLED